MAAKLIHNMMLHRVAAKTPDWDVYKKQELRTTMTSIARCSSWNLPVSLTFLSAFDPRWADSGKGRDETPVITI